jgi:hypothetical protein
MSETPKCVHGTSVLRLCEPCIAEQVIATADEDAVDDMLKAFQRACEALGSPLPMHDANKRLKERAILRNEIRARLLRASSSTGGNV